jgi:hypothetical protein
VTEQFDPQWLALREPYDHAARSVALARRLAAALPQRPRLLDLGAGTGSLFRFLAPIIGRGQDWLLLDADAALLDEAFGRTAAWARQHRFAATAERDTLRVTTPTGLWRMQVLLTPLLPSREVGALRRQRTLPDLIANADAVVCTALLDLVSATWLNRLCRSLSVPFLACLSADGRDTWRPAHPSDALVRRCFRRDMRRDKGFGHALGTDAVRAFPAVTASATSDWHIPRTALAMQRVLIEGTADAARRVAPAHGGAIAAWQEARLRQALRGRLAITIGHRDILILPSGG